MTKRQHQIKKQNEAYQRGVAQGTMQLESLHREVTDLKVIRAKLQTSREAQLQQAQVMMMQAIANLSEAASKLVLSFNNHL